MSVRRDIVQDLGVYSISSWEEDENSIKFHTSMTLTYDNIKRLSEALGSDKINFNFGEDGEPGYSSWTPGTEGCGGYIEVLF
jgi:hypothetical protein